VAGFKVITEVSKRIVVGVGTLKLIHSEVASVLEHWVAMLGLDPAKTSQRDQPTRRCG
jgi:hypothetical protein